MSFILDALRKSEHQRQRTTGPGLAEVPVAKAAAKSNVWATAAVALLIVNLVAVGVLLLRRATRDEHAAAPVVAPAVSPAASTSAAATADTSSAAPANPTLDAAASTPTPVTAPTRSPVREDASGRNPLAEEVGEPALEPTLAAGAASVPAGPPAVTRHAAAPRGSVVYAPLPEAADLPYTPPTDAGPPPAARAPVSLPSADEMVARGVPELHLDLHVYSNVPQQRFIFVNSRKYREGEALQEGPVVEQITQDGAVMSYQGTRFRLSHD